MALPRFLTKSVGEAAGALGAAQDLLPGSGKSRLTNVATAIVDPNQVLSSPGGVFNNGKAFTPVAAPASGGQAPAGGGGSPSGTAINTGGTDLSSTGGGSGSGVDVNLLHSLRSDIANTITDLTGKYHSIMDAIDSSTADAAQQTEKTYAGQEGDTTQSYNDQVPGLNFGYYANGIGDSTYRGTALDSAANALKSSINTIEGNKTSDLQKIAATGASKKAGYAADLGNLGNVGATANADTNASDLTSTKADLQTRASQVAADMPNFQTGAQFSQALKAAAPTQDVTPVIAALTKVVQGQAAAPVKAQVAGQILNNSNLSDADKKKLSDQFGLTATA